MSSDSVLEVAMALVWHEGRLLITRRRPDQHLAGLWEFPGGKCLPGESPEACVEREVLEEVGVICEAFARRETIQHVYPEHAVRLYPIECRYVSGPPEAIQVADWAWVAPADLPGYSFPPANVPLMEELARAATR